MNLNLTFSLASLRGFPGGSVLKNPPANAVYMGLTLGREDPLKKKMATHYSSLGNPMDRGAQWATVHRITRVRCN